MRSEYIFKEELQHVLAALSPENRLACEISLTTGVRHVSPHSCRKVWAVEQYHRTGDLKKVQKLLNHSSEAVTQLYALADVLTERRVRPGQRQARRN